MEHLSTAWDEASEEQICMVTHLFLAVTEKTHTGSQKRDRDGAFVDANPYAQARASKYTMEEWHTLTTTPNLQCTQRSQS